MPYEPFDRLGQQTMNERREIGELPDRFAALRLRAFELDARRFERRARTRSSVR
jgi:hypothetical protein